MGEPKGLFGTYTPELAERIMKKIVYALPGKRHDLGDLFYIGIHIEAEIDHLLLPARKTGEHLTHLFCQVHQVLLADKTGLDRRCAIEQILEMPLARMIIMPGAIDRPGEIVPQRFEEIIFYKGGFTNGQPVCPKRQEEILDTVLYKLLIAGKPCTIIKEVLVMGPHQSVEGICIAITELIPKKEIFVQEVDGTHSSR